MKVLETGTERLSKTFVPTRKATWRRNPEEQCQRLRRRDKLKSQITLYK